MSSKRIAVLSLAACLSAWGVAAEAPGFVGRVVVEWPDDDPFVPRMRLVEDFAFRDASGKLWLAPKDRMLDGRSIPPLFRELVGPPFAAEYRRSSVVYESHALAMQVPWREVQRLFYAASVVEGVPGVDAKRMYAVLYAAGPRWELRGSSCYRGCHAAAESLLWTPATSAQEIAPVVQWVRQADPPLDQIDRRLDATIMKPGPHIFVQGHSPPIVADPAPPNDGAVGSEPTAR
jgi:hypothetical protein